MIYLIVEADLLGKARIIEGVAGRNISYEKNGTFLGFSGLSMPYHIPDTRPGVASSPINH